MTSMMTLSKCIPSTNQHRSLRYCKILKPFLTLILFELSPIQGTNDCNTQTIEFREGGVNHVEGGWPKEIDVSESDQVTADQTRRKTLMLHIQISRFIKKIEKEDKFLTSCLTIAREAEHKVKQNNCVDIYRFGHGNVDTVSKSCNCCQGLL